MLLRSSLLPIPHGFSIRRGGVSEKPFDTLNVSAAVGDSAERVRENVQRIARAAGTERIATVNQVHGKAVVRAERAGADADAVWTDEPGAGVAVKTADCVPILLVDPDRRRVAAVHSGWKGTQLEVVSAAIDALESSPERLLAAIGPSIRVCCYEVSEDLARLFADKFGPEVIARDRDDAAPHLDLARAIAASLRKKGVRQEHIDLLPHCTSCEPADFFSHRRDRGVTGRHLNLAVCAF